jgi:hypothetical protein
MKPIALHSQAAAEIEAAARHYEQEREGLGVEFQASVEDMLKQVQGNPAMFSPFGDKGDRCCMVNRFPYTIYYHEFEDRIWVKAVAHQSRRPGYWARRRPE